MKGQEIKEKLQKFFDKEIISIFKKDNLYYVILNDGQFVKPVYEIDVNGNNISELGIPAPALDKDYEFIWSKNN
ncbi:MAG: hypothetical protein II411_03120 [Lachnospiraceae bacterium]|nr:hypothetical protein [Lachnospiraceae bacterium]